MTMEKKHGFPLMQKGHLTASLATLYYFRRSRSFFLFLFSLLHRDIISGELGTMGSTSGTSREVKQKKKLVIH